MLSHGRNMKRNTECSRSILFPLRDREYSKGSQRKKDCRILKKLICQGCRTFQRVWNKQSSRSFSYEAGWLFADNFRTSFYGYSRQGQPRHMYTISREGVYDRHRIEDAMLYSRCMETVTRPEAGEQASILCLIAAPADCKLVQYHLDSGQVLNTIFLSRRIKFKSLFWIEENRLFAVRSTTNLQMQLLVRAGIEVPKHIVLAVFSAHPIQFQGMFQVEKRVFGADVVNAVLIFEMLVVMHQSGFVRFYSLKYIMDKFKVFEAPLNAAYGEEDVLCGEYPTGLPLNITITDRPPVLFEVRCADQDVQMGGFPWHYLISPHGTMGFFEVHSLKDRALAQNGELDTNHLSTEPDRAVFHNDNSGRIMHIQSTQIRLLQIRPDDETPSGYRVDQCRVIDLNRNKPQEDTCIRFTSSGRLVKKRASIDEISECPNMVIHQVDYEDDLDLMWAATMYNEDDHNRAIVSFHDNCTGQLLKEVELFVPWKEYYEQHVYVDLDTIVQVTKVRPGKFFCFFYRLSGDLNQKTVPGDSAKSNCKTMKTEDSRRTRSRRSYQDV